MKYYKDQQNKVYAFNSDGSQDQLIKSDLTAITEEEKNTLLAPTQEQLNLVRISEIKARLIKVDSESIRPLRAIANGTQTQFDTDKLSSLDSERLSLVSELVALNG